MTGFIMTGEKTDEVPHLLHQPTAARARHGFFGCAGGVSSGVYDSLNCGFGSDDDPALVAQNRDRAASALGLRADRLAAVWQVHSADAVIATGGAPSNRAQLTRADGLVTTERGLGLAILTADCLPLLMVDRDGAVIGACHAGWRGAADGIVTSTLALMRDKGAGEITALIGPTIRQPSYQVGGDMREACLASVAPGLRDAAASCFIDDEDGRFRFDLPALVGHQLAGAGVIDIADCGEDTYPAPDHIAGSSGADSFRFFSHRRATHAAEADCGRQISIIALAE